MTDQIHALTVVLDRDVRDDAARTRIKLEIHQRLWDALHGKTGD